jgi:hypothetical protein
MLTLAFANLDAALMTTWGPLAAGMAVTSLVIGSGFIFGLLRRRRRRIFDFSREEDLPWDDLLRLLEKRNRDREAKGLPPEQPTEEVLGELMAILPTVPDPKPLELAEDREFQALGGDERRIGRRRWGNPTEVQLRSDIWAYQVHGLVVNRSTGGLGIFADKEVPPSTPLHVRAAEAPPNVPAVRVEVRHCHKIGRGFLLGCRFSEEIPWNARVWFG